MKKTIAAFLTVILILALFMSFAACGAFCNHEYVNGVCKKCNAKCTHSYKDGVCTVCNQADPNYQPPCEHNYVKGYCTKCNQADPDYVPCVHNYIKGVCTKCGEEDPNYVPTYYRNPILESVCADPHIIRHRDTYYIFSTGLTIYKSNDCVNWELAGTMGISPTWGTQGAGSWAPDIAKIGNKYMVYYSRSSWGDPNPGIGVASADHPMGPWTDHGCLFLSKDIGVENSIDAHVFVGQDNKVYMMWGSFRGIYGVELTEDGMALKGGVANARENKVLIAGKVGEWDGATFEGAYVIYKDGYYYFFGSSGTCCDGLNSTYNVRIGRSRNPLGPYLDKNGNNMADNRNVGYTILQGTANLVGPGHNSVFIDDAGDYWIVYHVWKNDNDVAKGRYLAIDKLIWDDDGWFTVKNAMPSSKKTVGPYIVSHL